jgi:hypothetical protein
LFNHYAFSRISQGEFAILAGLLTSEEDKILALAVNFSALLSLPFWPGITTGEKPEVADGGNGKD